MKASTSLKKIGFTASFMLVFNSFGQITPFDQVGTTTGGNPCWNNTVHDWTVQSGKTFIDACSKVGIGITSPAAQLHVSGGQALQVDGMFRVNGVSTLTGNFLLDGTFYADGSANVSGDLDMTGDLTVDKSLRLGPVNGNQEDALILGNQISSDQRLVDLAGAGIYFHINNDGSIINHAKSYQSPAIAGIQWGSGALLSLTRREGGDNPGDPAYYYEEFRVERDGLVRAREIKVDTDIWPDYVFAEDYNLPTLSQVESYIEENNHLPGVPSAREVESNGIQLGEMSKIQMEKIEEMYLHMIEMEKRINVLEQENKELQMTILRSKK